MFYYGGSVPNALHYLFPNIGIETSKFVVRGAWKDTEQRRNFFINYAKANGFDPLNTNKWYSHPQERIRAVKVCYSYLFVFFLTSLSLFL